MHNVYDQIAQLSTAVTLHAGCLTATGTPSGVGFAMTPQVILRVGDVVRAEIDHVGFIESTVIAAPVEQ